MDRLVRFMGAVLQGTGGCMVARVVDDLKDEVVWCL